MSSIKIVKAPINAYVPKNVLEELVGVSVSLNAGPPVTYFGCYDEAYPNPKVTNIDPRYNAGLTRQDIYYVSSNTLAECCGYAGHYIAKEWLRKNMPERWIALPESVCEYQP